MPRHDPSEKTKKEILDTAIHLFRENGWDNVNIEDIVAAVGVTRGAFYHYFKSREALIIAVIDQVFYDDNPFILASKQEGLNALERLRFALATTIGSDFNDTGIVKELRKAISNPVIFKSELFSTLNTLSPYIEKLIVEGNEDGSMSVPYPKQAAQSFSLLFSIWLSPFVFTVSHQGFADKVFYLEYLGKQIGIPVINDELKELIFKQYEFHMKN